jgi:hypothetical protein
VLFFLRFISLWIDQGVVPEITFLSWLFTFSISFNAISFAMWFDYEENKHLNPPLERREVIREPS